MEVNRTAVWVCLIVGAAGGIAYSLRVGLRQRYYPRHASWRDAPGPFLAVCLGATLAGTGAGMAIAALFIIAAAIVAQIENLLSG